MISTFGDYIMPRKARIKSTTGTYHVLIRAQKKRGIFRQNADFEYFIQLMKDSQQPADRKEPLFQVIAYSLMPGYVHLLVREGKEDIAAAMRRIMVQYAPYYNEKYNTYGRVFYDRFRSEPCDTEEYLQAVVGYIHYVPVKHKRCLNPADYQWSSCRELQDIYPMSSQESVSAVRLTEDRRREFTDYKVEKQLKRLCGIDSMEQFPLLDKKIRRSALKIVRLKGVSLGQLSRVAGVTINVVRKARIFYRLPLKKSDN